MTGAANPIDYRKVQMIMDLRNLGLRDKRIIEAMELMPRDQFISSVFEDQAYSNYALPISCGQTISQPMLVAYMTDQLELNERHKVLEIGTGSGYQTAILSRLCRRVYSIERYRTLSLEARERFEKLNLRNITCMVGDGIKGWPSQAPFDRIIVTAAATRVPSRLVEQLSSDGIMIIPVKTGPGRQELQKITVTDSGVEIDSLMAVKFVPLVEGIARERQ